MTAQVFPSDLSAQHFQGRAARLWTTLVELRDGLGDGFRVFHGLHWSRLDAGLTVSGRLQFVVLTPHGGLVCLILRTGLLQMIDGRCVKKLGDETEDLVQTLHQQMNLLQSQFQSSQREVPHLEPLLYCPDHRMTSGGGFGLPRERVLDAGSKTGLVQMCEAIDTKIADANLSSDAQAVEEFLLDVLALVPEVGVISEAATQWTQTLQEGLDCWVRRLSFKPYRLLINGIAGSGKSLLAMSQLRSAHLGKERSLYLCYNRPLASHVTQLVRQEGLKGVTVLNFHALCDRFLKDRGVVFEFNQPDAFGRLVELALEQPKDQRWVFDRLIVDEGQDFDPSWMSLIERMTHSNTRWFYLQDRAQNLYAKTSLDCSKGWVALNVSSNYRNPVRLVQTLNTLRRHFTLEEPELFDMQASCPVEGFEPDWLVYDSETDLLEQTSRAITHCLKKGFARDHIVVLSLSGFNKSKVLQLNQLGPHSMRHFTGQYGQDGEQLFTQGAVLAESVYRFKGQSANAVILTEVDFDQLDERAFRKLFVGMTRAKLMVTLVSSRRTAKVLNNPEVEQVKPVQSSLF